MVFLYFKLPSGCSRLKHLKTNITSVLYSCQHWRYNIFCRRKRVSVWLLFLEHLLQPSITLEAKTWQFLLMCRPNIQPSRNFKLNLVAIISCECENDINILEQAQTAAFQLSTIYLLYCCWCIFQSLFIQIKIIELCNLKNMWYKLNISISDKIRIKQLHFHILLQLIS